jgi:hypothetical protein
MPELFSNQDINIKGHTGFGGFTSKPLPRKLRPVFISSPETMTKSFFDWRHGHMARGGHRLPKFSPRPAMPFPSTPCGRATLETALQLFQGLPACKAGGLRPSSTPLDTPRRTPMDWREYIETIGICEKWKGKLQSKTGRGPRLQTKGFGGKTPDPWCRPPNNKQKQNPRDLECSKKCRS